jgi:hypothetical protein
MYSRYGFIMYSHHVSTADAPCIRHAFNCMKSRRAERPTERPTERLILALSATLRCTVNNDPEVWLLLRDERENEGGMAVEVEVEDRGSGHRTRIGNKAALADASLHNFGLQDCTCTGWDPGPTWQPLARNLPCRRRSLAALALAAHPAPGCKNAQHVQLLQVHHCQRPWTAAQG